MSQSRAEAVTRSPLARVERQAGTLDAILAASADLVYLCGRAGEFLYANPSGAEIWGLDRTLILGRTWHELSVPPDIAATFDAQRTKVFETGRTIVDAMCLPSALGERIYE